ncbi:hypothetical protein [Serratia sp. UGAL515B_01]|uniref:hypothetical protein n=1 Tax=Serratia sp. UGAL515B_01 TaxID=2986763 RepID=UPI002954006A|nr:hypothetical protein [Serratia sp. UGAL515B_01]WON78519.1 hypothetical protein OK023_07775 [Serratia sp. UGAL515B_01]
MFRIYRPESLFYRVPITDGDFETAWNNFNQKILPTSGYQPTGNICYEHYLNDLDIDGYDDLDIYQKVMKV